MLQRRERKMRWNAIAATGALLLAACGGDPGGEPPPADDAPPGAVLSAPIPRDLVPRPGPAGASLVFVAVPPVTVPRAASAVVRTSRGDSAQALVLDGGFDPVALAAAEGDEVEVRIVDSAGAATEVELVAARRRPRVVRTSPQPRSTDVPLNVRVTIVFSAPMDSAAVAAGVRVTRGGVPVPGTLQRAADGLSVEFAPAAQYAAQADYDVTISPDVRDVLGTPLGEPVQVPFRTGAAAATIDRMVLSVAANQASAYTTFAGEPIPMQAYAGWRQSDGRIVWQIVPTQWSAAPEGQVRLTELSPGQVRVELLEAGGEAVVTATVAPGISRSVLLRAHQDLPPDLASTRVWYAPDDGNGTGSMGVWTERLDGTGREQLFALSELPAANSLAPWFTLDCHEPHGFAMSRTGRLAITVASASPVNHNGGVWIKDGPGVPLRRVTSTAEAGSANFPAWSFDGARLAYWFDRPDQGVTELRVVEADGSGQRVLEQVTYARVWSLDPPSEDYSSPCPRTQYVHGGVPIVWHPDGQRVLKWIPEGTAQVALDGSGSSLYLRDLQAGPWTRDGERQILFRAGNPYGPEFYGFVGYFWGGTSFSVASREGLVLDPLRGLAPLDMSSDGRLQVVLYGYHPRLAIVTSDRTAVRPLTRLARGFVP